MRLPEIDRGDTFARRLLIAFISAISGMRLPDAARVALYHKDFFGVRWELGLRRRCAGRARGASASVS